MPSDELDDEEREILRKHRSAKQRDSFRVRIRDDKGNEGDLPYTKARPWFQKIFGIDLDTEDKQDEGGDAGAGDGKSDDANVKRFQSGRRVG